MRQFLLVGLAGLFILLTGCGKESGVLLQGKSNGYTAEVRIDPGIVGPNTYSVKIKDEKNQTVTTGKATLYFGMEGMDHGKSKQVLKGTDDGIWQGEGPHLMMPGEWQIQLVWGDKDKSKNQKGTYPFDFSLTLKDDTKK